jgi:abortive infection bacteriophage resistance protein
MHYNKPPLNIQSQIGLLKSRGLQFRDETKAIHYLSNISYYRLRAYSYPFQDNNLIDHPFQKGIYFEDIISVYVFDRKLRLLIFNAIEKIEIAIRTKMVYHFSLSYGSHWHENSALYLRNNRFVKDMSDLYKEVDRSTETFITHYTNKYTTPVCPPSWMSLEVASMGMLSKIFSNLKNNPEKKNICRDFGVIHYSVLESWLHSICHVRNICAHHGRLWNRRLTAPPELPKSPIFQFLTNTNLNINKLYPILCCMTYILHIISPSNNFNSNLKELLCTFPIVNIKEMGFPKDWENEPIWQ